MSQSPKKIAKTEDEAASDGDIGRQAVTTGHIGSQSVTMLAAAGPIDYSHVIDRGMPSMAGITANRD
jgi:hypothetical protein